MTDGYHNQAYKQLFTKVEWLESTGTQFIDTGLHLTDQSSYEVECELFQPYAKICGSRVDAFTQNVMVSLDNQQIYIDFGDYIQTRLSIPFTSFQFPFKAIISNRKDARGVNNGQFHNEKKYTGPAFVSQHSFHLFNVNNYSTAWPSSCRFRISRLKVDDGATMDMYAVKFKNEEGKDEGGMFDKVSGMIFRNAGSGKFIIGPDK